MLLLDLLLNWPDLKSWASPRISGEMDRVLHKIAMLLALTCLGMYFLKVLQRLIEFVCDYIVFMQPLMELTYLECSVHFFRVPWLVVWGYSSGKASLSCSVAFGLAFKRIEIWKVGDDEGWRIKMKGRTARTGTA